MSEAPKAVGPSTTGVPEDQVAAREPITVSVVKAVELTSLSRSFLYNEMKAKRLPFTHKGGRRLIFYNDLVTYLKS